MGTVSRSNERGAALFIVVLVIALLTAVGMFAARAASLTDVAAGYDRQALQTLALAEYAAKAGTAQMGTTASSYLNLTANSMDQCEVNRRITNPDTGQLTNPGMLGLGITRASCYNIYCHEILNAFSITVPGLNLLAPQTESGPGSLGPPLVAGQTNSYLDGVCKVELTESYQRAPPAGMDRAADQFRAYQVTMTSFAQVRTLAAAPAPPSPWCSADTSSSTANVQAVRALVTVMAHQ